MPTREQKRNEIRCALGEIIQKCKELNDKGVDVYNYRITKERGKKVDMSELSNYDLCVMICEKVDDLKKSGLNLDRIVFSK